MSSSNSASALLYLLRNSSVRPPRMALMYSLVNSSVVVYTGASPCALSLWPTAWSRCVLPRPTAE